MPGIQSIGKSLGSHEHDNRCNYADVFSYIFEARGATTALRLPNCFPFPYLNRVRTYTTDMTTNAEKIDEKASSSHGTEPEGTTTSKQDEKSGHAPPLNGAKIMEVMNAEYALALSTGPQLKASSWRSIQLFGILLVAFMGSLSNGFDGSGKFL